jgi:hypothetical protein
MTAAKKMAVVRERRRMPLGIDLVYLDHESVSALFEEFVATNDRSSVAQILETKRFTSCLC